MKYAFLFLCLSVWSFTAIFPFPVPTESLFCFLKKTQVLITLGHVITVLYQLALQFIWKVCYDLEMSCMDLKHTQFCFWVVSELISIFALSH